MKIEITITPESANILAAAIVAAVGGDKVTCNTGNGAAEAPAKPAKAAKAEKVAPPPVTLDDLRVAATKCVDAGKKDKLLQINKDSFGVAGISKLDPKQYADALKAYEALAEEEEDPTA
jgi:hypothetical protein